ncbi:MAG: hypothetical protein AAF360_20185 [Pseudomonadota bacterium]
MTGSRCAALAASLVLAWGGGGEAGERLSPDRSVQIRCADRADHRAASRAGYGAAANQPQCEPFGYVDGDSSYDIALGASESEPALD